MVYRFLATMVTFACASSSFAANDYLLNITYCQDANNAKGERIVVFARSSEYPDQSSLPWKGMLQISKDKDIGGESMIFDELRIVEFGKPRDLNGKLQGSVEIGNEMLSIEVDFTTVTGHGFPGTLTTQHAGTTALNCWVPF